MVLVLKRMSHFTNLSKASTRKFEKARKMLAVLDKAVAKAPEGLRAPASGGEENAIHEIEALLQHFSEAKPGSVKIRLGSAAGALAYSSETKERLFSVVNGIFCLFEGHFTNIPSLKKQYCLSKTANEAIIVIEAYKTLRDIGPCPADRVIRDFNGKFAFVLFDITRKSTFIASDADGGVSFFWGVDFEDRLVLSDDAEIVKKACGKSFAPFPEGCFFTTSKGLQSFEHPLNEMKQVPRVDNQGEMCGATYIVDLESKKPAMPRVGSAINWTDF